MLYSIDTSGFLDGWKRRYPPDVFPVIWDNLTDLIENGSLIATDEVLNELKAGDDDIYTWASAREKMFLPLDADIQQAVIKVLTRHSSWVPPDRSRNMADPFVIAVAMVKGCTVVSAETLSTSPLPERVRIPNVCNTFGIRHIEFLDLMREQGWKFTRR